MNDRATTNLNLQLLKTPIPAPQGMVSLQNIDQLGICLVDDQGNAERIGGIEEVVSEDESIRVTNPNGPIVDLGIGSPDPTDGFLWLRGDTNSAEYLTANGSNQVSLWQNQFPPAISPEAIDVQGDPLPTAEWPVWHPDIQNGLGAVRWTRANGTNMNKVYPEGTLNQPTNDGEPVLVVAVVRPTDMYGGMVMTLRMNGTDCEFSNRYYNPAPLYQCPMSSNRDNDGVLWTSFVDYTDQTLLMDWMFFGGGIVPDINVNEVNRELLAPATTMLNYTGLAGYSIGFNNATFAGWWEGYIMELIAYRFGTYAYAVANYEARRRRARLYLKAKWGLSF